MSREKTKNVFIGDNDYFLGIGNVYFSTSKKPSRWKRWALRFCFGITFITRKQKEKILNDTQSTQKAGQ